MAVRLRLMRMGKRKQPTYRVVAADKRKARNGRFIEVIGFYDPRRDPSVIDIENEKAVRWLSEGAQPSERVEKLLKISGAWDEFKGLPPGTSVTAPPVTPPKPTLPEHFSELYPTPSRDPWLAPHHPSQHCLLFLFCRLIINLLPLKAYCQRYQYRNIPV